MTRFRTTIYGDHQATRCDAFAGGLGQEGRSRRQPSYSGVLVQVFQKGFHAAPALRHAGIGAISQNGRSGPDRAVGRLVRPAWCTEAQQSAASHDPLPSSQTLGKKGGLEGLLGSVFAEAHRTGLIDAKAEAAIDSTGMEASV